MSRTLISEVHNVADVSIVPCQSSVPDTAERQSRTTIVTKKTTIILKTFKEEEFINDQWVTTDEYQVLYHDRMYTFALTTQYVLLQVYLMTSVRKDN